VNIDPVWSSILDIISQVIIPTWNNLIQYIPLLLTMLLLVSIAGLAWYWQRNAALNRSRLPRPLPAGRKPDELHLPGPSLWPFVAPVGLLLIVFAIVFGLGSLANLALLGLGIVIALAGIVGWYLDAHREYAHVEAGAHGGALASGAPQLPDGRSGTPGWALQPPEGLHLPGPSAWPFLAPVGLGFIVAGLIFGPALIVGGLIMAAIAAIGWLLDSGRELQDVEEHGHPSQGDRDPERAWPRRLIPLYVFVGAVALLITLAPWLLSLLPGSGA
jgi:hypothetical protein